MNEDEIETLSKAFTKANFEGYRHLKGSFFGIGQSHGGILNEIHATDLVKLLWNKALAMDWNQSGLELQAPDFDPALYQDQPDSVP